MLRGLRGSPSSPATLLLVLLVAGAGAAASGWLEGPATGGARSPADPFLGPGAFAPSASGAPPLKTPSFAPVQRPAPAAAGPPSGRTTSGSNRVPAVSAPRSALAGPRLRAIPRNRVSTPATPSLPSGEPMGLAPAAGWNVTFNETGLPSPDDWTVKFAGMDNTTHASQLEYTGLANGSYPFSVSGSAGFAADPASGSLTVDGVDVEQRITFSEAAPPAVTISLSPDPVDVGSTLTISTSVTGGSAPYSVTYSGFPPPCGTGSEFDWSCAPSEPGTFAVEAEVTDSADRTAFANGTLKVLAGGPYTLTFRETGLPSGTAWNLSVGGSTSGTNTTSIVVREPNGSYPFSILPLLGYSANPSGGNLTVAGASLTQSIAFTDAPTTIRVVNPAGPPNSRITLVGSGYLPTTGYVACFAAEPVRCSSGVSFLSTGNGSLPTSPALELTVPPSADSYIVLAGPVFWDGSVATVLSTPFSPTTASLALVPSVDPFGTSLSVRGSGLVPDFEYQYCVQATLTACPNATTTVFTATPEGTVPSGTTISTGGVSRGYLDVSQNGVPALIVGSSFKAPLLLGFPEGEALAGLALIAALIAAGIAAVGIRRRGRPCPLCGARLPRRAAFCGNCGKRLRGPEGPPG